MKKVALFATIVMALALCASAQQMIDFTHLPDTGTPASIPSGYSGLNWSGLDYVDAITYNDANGNPNIGAGFYTGPEVMVAFGGGPLCFPNYGAAKADGVATKHICSVEISAGLGPTALSHFQANFAIMSAGWIGGSITVQAYNNGVQVGSDEHYSLTTNTQRIDFPNWGQITELRITPGPRASFVLYVLQVQ